MSSVLPNSIQECIKSLSKLPGIGNKTATRLAFYLLNRGQSELDQFGASVQNLKCNLVTCSVCANIAESDPCSVCGDEKRDASCIMVVEDPMDVIAFEQMGSYQGTYHVLHGLLSPIDGIGPEQLRLQELFGRIRNMEKGEIIIATNPNLEGEATAQFIRDHIQNSNVSVTRIAKGLPMGGDLEYADSTTLKQSLMGRVRL